MFDTVVLQKILSFDITNLNSPMRTCKGFHRNITKNNAIMSQACDHYKPLIEELIDDHLKRALNNTNPNRITSLVFKTNDRLITDTIDVMFQNDTMYNYPTGCHFNQTPSQLHSVAQLIKLQQLYKDMKKHIPNADSYDYDPTEDILQNFFACPCIRKVIDPSYKEPEKPYTFNDYAYYILVLFIIAAVCAVLVMASIRAIESFY